jgi:ferredoxin
MITADCINCGACEPECPNTAIYQGGVEYDLDGAKKPALSAEVFYIVPEKCTECVGFHDQEACAAVCPVDVCIPNPDIPETEAQLLERAKQLHPEAEFGADFPSRFRADSNETAAATESAAAAPAAAPAPAASAVAAAAPVGLAIPPMDEWEVPIDCHSCQGVYGVAFKHLRSGAVLRCPFCTTTYIVTTGMQGGLDRALREFHQRWVDEFESFEAQRRRELREFEDRQSRELEELNERLKTISKSVRPPGAPRKRAWIFG